MDIASIPRHPNTSWGFSHYVYWVHYSLLVYFGGPHTKKPQDMKFTFASSHRWFLLAVFDPRFSGWIFWVNHWSGTQQLERRTCLVHGNLRDPTPPRPRLPPRNKAVIRPYEGKSMVNRPLIRPYFLGVNVALRGSPLVPMIGRSGHFWLSLSTGILDGVCGKSHTQNRCIVWVM